MRQRQEVIRCGVWLYAGSIETPVYVIRQNWDYYFDDGYTDGEPSLNDDGEAYYLSYAGPQDGEFHRPFSRTCLSEYEAIQLAEELLAGGVRWQG